MKKILLLLLLLPVFARGQIITTIAGGGSATGNGIPAISAEMNHPTIGAFDKWGNYYCGTDIGYNSVFKITPAGILYRVAGDGSGGFFGDGGPATAAKLYEISGVAIDTAGNIYIADLGNARIRKVNVATGVITTYAGNGMRYSSGDGLPATAASFVPENVCSDAFGNIYILDSASIVRKINASGIITAYAGNGTLGFTGDNGPATAAEMAESLGLCTDSAGNLYIGCVGRIRKVDKNTGIINTIAGNGLGGPYIGEGMHADSAEFDPYEITHDLLGNIYIADPGNERVFKIGPDSIFHTIAGTGTGGFSGDGGPATMAQINNPAGVVTDSCGNLFIADAANDRVRKIIIDTPCYVVLPSLSVNSKKVNSEEFIYPNPTNDILHIDNIKSHTTYCLTNIIGTTVQQGTLKEGNNSISVQLLPPGMYMLELVDEDGKRVVKVVKE